MQIGYLLSLGDFMRVFLFLGLFFLASCGQKGDLYLSSETTDNHNHSYQNWRI